MPTTLTQSVTDEGVTINGVYYTQNEFESMLDQAVEIEGSHHQTRSAAAIAAGTYFIPGVGEVLIAATGAIVVAGVTIKVGSWLYNTITDWFETRAFNKSAEKAVKDLGDVNSNRAIHILKTEHNWSSLVPGGPKDPNRWNKIKEIIKKVLADGKESKYGSAYKKTLNYKGKVVEVTFQKFNDGVISISNAWVK